MFNTRYNSQVTWHFTAEIGWSSISTVTSPRLWAHSLWGSVEANGLRWLCGLLTHLVTLGKILMPLEHMTHSWNAETLFGFSFYHQPVSKGYSWTVITHLSLENKIKIYILEFAPNHLRIFSNYLYLFGWIGNSVFWWLNV